MASIFEVFRIVVSFGAGMICIMLLGDFDIRQRYGSRISRRLAVKVNGNDENLSNDAPANTFHAEGARILCWVMTYPKNLWSKALAVNRTWGHRCDKTLYMSDVDDPDFPAIGLNTTSGRNQLAIKSMAAFDYIHKHHFDDADWFLKADDDTYVIVENLRFFLSSQNHQNPVFFGTHFVRPEDNLHYFSGGGGYVLSKEALRRYGNRPDDVCSIFTRPEDVVMGRCMEELGVRAENSFDDKGRHRFHCFHPTTFLEGDYPPWFYQYDVKNGTLSGLSGMSQSSISFHYITPRHMYLLDFLIYHVQATAPVLTQSSR